jgi:hypothetical protein
MGRTKDFRARVIPICENLGAILYLLFRRLLFDDGLLF